ncbi:hypothetical protein AGMMS49546_08270 [Spirochaetia bacterium]|nr:hypothetical protein AGMMS49546_08270 [Spirochaetia bacterium]
MAKKYRDEIAMVCHDMMKAARTVGGVTDAEMEDFEKGCFADEPDTTSQSANVPKTVTPALAKRG